MKKFIKNNRFIYVQDIGENFDPAQFEKKPVAVLLSARDTETQKYGYWQKIIEYFFSQQVKYIICVGSFSEQLHDDIDDHMFQFEDENDIPVSENLVTTFHSSDTADEISNFFVYATDIDENTECLLTILDPNNKEDVNLLEIIENE